MLLKGILLWPNITTPGTTEFSKDQYSLDLSLDEETASKLRAEGFNVRDDKEYSPFVTIKRKVRRKDGSMNSVPKLVYADKNPLEFRVGNGSSATVQCRPYEWEFGGRTGKGLDLQAVQVTNLIEYEGTTMDGDELGITNEEEELEF